MANQFDSIFIKKPKRNRFNLSFQNKLTMKFGDLVPFMVQEVIPGDKFKVATTHAIRLQPTVAPIMQNIEVTKHFFYVPFRLLWAKWEEFITGGESGSATPVIPKLSFTNCAENSLLDKLKAGSLADYLGFPTIDKYTDTGEVCRPDGREVSITQNYNMLPFLAYQLIWQEYYRDQNLMNKLGTIFPWPHEGNCQVQANLEELLTLRRRCWRKDEFTSALPWPQRGVATPVPVQIENKRINTGNSVYLSSNGRIVSDEPLSTNEVGKLVDSSGNAVVFENAHTYTKDNFTANIGSVTDIRRALKVQEFLEKMGLGGSRYAEVIRNFFGLKPSDGRLQRPIYLGGDFTPFSMEAVANTTPSSDSAAQGQLSGNGGSIGSSPSFKGTFEEHGFIMGIISVIPRAAYYQGTPQKFLRETRTEYYWPQFAHIGEQPILGKRLFTHFDVSGKGKDNETFGYEPRYAEMRFNNDEVHGEFRTNLRYWHMARHFHDTPKLNSSFVMVQNDISDVVMAVNSYHAAPLLCNINVQCLATRSVSKYGTPSL